MSARVSVVTVSSGKPEQDYYCYDAFFESCRRLEHDPIVLGGFAGLGSKPRLLKEAICAGRIATEFIMFTDCFDVVVQSSPEEAAELLEEHKTGVLWGAEKSCFPDANLMAKHPESDTEYCYINTGACIAKKSALLAMLEEMKADEIPNDSQRTDGSWSHFNDQGLIMTQFCFGRVPMRLDYRCQLVNNLCSVTMDELELTDDKKVRNVKTGSVPICLHFNGPAKTSGLREPILAHLGLQ